MRCIWPLLVLATACQFDGVPPGSGSDANPAADAAVSDAPAVDWALPDYRRRRSFAIDNTNRPALADFPVAIRAVAEPTMVRDQLRVRNASDTADVPFEVELLSNDLLLWVKTDLPENGSTDVWLYYDYEGPNVPDASDAQATFDGFLGAFHFYQTFDDAGDPVDNVGTGPNFEVVVGLSNAESVLPLGPALVMESLTFDQEYVEATDPQFIAPPGAVMTYEMWFTSPDLGGGKTLVDNFETSVPALPDCQGLQAYILSDGTIVVWFGAGDDCNGGTANEAFVQTTANVEDNTWHHIAMVVDRQNHVLRVYVDGQFDGEIAIDATGVSTNPTRLGEGVDFIGPYLGSIDEFRVSDVRRSDAWIEATHDNARIGSTMVTDRGEQVRP